MASRGLCEGRPAWPRVCRRFRFAALALALSAGTGTACNWTKFEDAANQAPVRSIGGPSGYDSTDFGKSITPLVSDHGSAAAFIATSINETHLVLVQIEANGNVKSSAVSGTALIDVAGSAITSVAEVPGSAPTRLLLGSPIVKNTLNGQMYTFDLPDPANPGTSPVGSGNVQMFAVPSLESTNSGLGRGLAAGYLGGVADIADYVMGSDNDLAVLVDGQGKKTSPTVSAPVGDCDVLYDSQQDGRYRVRRPLLVAHLWDDPAALGTDQLIIGLTHTGVTPGKLAFMNLTPAGTLNCLGTTSPAGAKPQFGHTFVTGDFDGDGKLDLLVGAPPQQAYVYLNWSDQALGTAPPNPIPILPPTPGVDFGFSVAALDVDGMTGDEALIGDPRALVGGKANAGHVLVFRYNASTHTMEQINELADLSPEQDAGFGYTVNALPFTTSSGSSRVVLVGAANEVFVYFRYGENLPKQAGQTIPDVRVP